jgi:hypothetical protein
MDATLIGRRAQRGAAARRLLVKRFNQAGTGNVTAAMDWKKHRWVRYRSTAASMHKYSRNEARRIDIRSRAMRPTKISSQSQNVVHQCIHCQPRRRRQSRALPKR